MAPDCFCLLCLSQVNQLSSYIGACERLLQTPVPLNYARHTSRFLTLWCLTLPIALIDSMGLLVVPVAGFVTWCLFGIQEIGLFIEHCALDDGAIFMDTITERVALDVIEQFDEPAPHELDGYPEEPDEPPLVCTPAVVCTPAAHPFIESFARPMSPPTGGQPSRQPSPSPVGAGLRMGMEAPDALADAEQRFADAEQRLADAEQRRRESAHAVAPAEVGPDARATVRETHGRFAPERRRPAACPAHQRQRPSSQRPQPG